MTRKKNKSVASCSQSLVDKGHQLQATASEEEDSRDDRSLLLMKDISSSTSSEKEVSEEGSDKPEKTCHLIQLLRGLNWKNIITVFYLWAVNMLICMCFSTMAPFFPKEVLLQ